MDHDSWMRLVETLQGNQLATARSWTDEHMQYTRHQMEKKGLDCPEEALEVIDGMRIDLDRRRGYDHLRTYRLRQADHRRSVEMREFRVDRLTDHTRQQQLIQTLTVMQSLQGQVTTLQGQVTALQGQVTALQGQQGPVGGPAQPELPEEAGSSS
ncbi:hypothetical protein Tco_0382666 [Tanacetum coccineum]